LKIDQEKCIGCKSCHPVCTQGAINALKVDGKIKSEIDQDECVECGACLRSEVCPKGAIFMPELEWPRLIRAQFGNPYFHPAPRSGAPSPPEIKVNDISGLIPRGVTDIVVEVGRPDVSTTFLDVQTIAIAMVGAGAKLHPGSSVATIMTDVRTGKIKDDVLEEKALCVMIHGRVDNSALKEALLAIKRVAAKIDSVFSLSVVNRLEEDSSAAAVRIAEEAAFHVSPHAKVNIGLGRRLEGEI
jgi:NAD-dependent dihydropyrimidine dehydrogenase PreA subunit